MSSAAVSTFSNCAACVPPRFRVPQPRRRSAAPAAAWGSLRAPARSSSARRASHSAWLICALSMMAASSRARSIGMLPTAMPPAFTTPNQQAASHGVWRRAAAHAGQAPGPAAAPARGRCGSRWPGTRRRSSARSGLAHKGARPGPAPPKGPTAARRSSAAAGTAVRASRSAVRAAAQAAAGASRAKVSTCAVAAGESGGPGGVMRRILGAR